MTLFRRSVPYAAIFGAFAILYCAAIGLGGFALSRLSTAGAEQEARASIARQSDLLLTKIVEEASAVRQAQNLSLIAMTEPARAKQRAEVHEAIGGVAALIGDYERYLGPAERPAFAKWRDSWNDYVSMNDTLNEKALNENLKVATEYYLYTMSDAFRQDFLASIDAVISTHAQSARDLGGWDAAYARIRGEVIWAAIIAALASILAIVMLVHRLAIFERHPRHIHEIAQRLDNTMLKIDYISRRIEAFATKADEVAPKVAGGPVGETHQVVTASHDLTAEAGVLKETVKSLISEVDAA
ncbi:MAG: hypothetical protein WCD42_03095 [Rhizomicrobium sp.]